MKLPMAETRSLRQLSCALTWLFSIMPILSGLAATGKIHQLMPKVPILMLSMHNGKALLGALRVAGAQGFAPQAECADKLLEAVDAVMHGETFFNAEPSSCIGLPE